MYAPKVCGESGEEQFGISSLFFSGHNALCNNVLVVTIHECLVVQTGKANGDGGGEGLPHTQFGWFFFTFIFGNNAR